MTKESPPIGLIKNSLMVRVRQFEKLSHRYEELKRSDECLDFDLIDHFWLKIDELCVNLKI